jgi:hypothetical protein
MQLTMITLPSSEAMTSLEAPKQAENNVLV